MKNEELGKLFIRLLDQSFKHNCHHLGSSFSSLPIISEIFAVKKDEDSFVLSCGHAAAALYVILEKKLGRDSSELFDLMGEHPHRNKNWEIDCSTGSLGMGISVAVGMALANKNTKVFCLVSDGECSEGVFWESIRFANQAKLENLFIYVNLNGWSGYDRVDKFQLKNDINSINKKVIIRETSNYPFEDFGLESHYMNLSENLYEKLKERICEDFL
jgi:transketolase